MQLMTVHMCEQIHPNTSTELIPWLTIGHHIAFMSDLRFYSNEMLGIELSIYFVFFFALFSCRSFVDSWSASCSPQSSRVHVLVLVHSFLLHFSLLSSSSSPSFFSSSTRPLLLLSFVFSSFFIFFLSFSSFSSFSSSSSSSSSSPSSRGPKISVVSSSFSSSFFFFSSPPPSLSSFFINFPFKSFYCHTYLLSFNSAWVGHFKFWISWSKSILIQFKPRVSMKTRLS